MRIRAYIINYMEDPKRESTLIPPENELCRIFNVTRPTVRNAIKGLVEDGYLIPRRGMGTYINQEKLNLTLDHQPVIGIIRGDGRNITNPIAHETGKIVMMNGMSVQPIYLSNSDDPQRLIEVLQNGITAVIWENPEGHKELMQALKEAGIPQLTIGHDNIAGFDCIFFPQSMGEPLADYLYDNGHVHMLFADFSLDHSCNNKHLIAGSWLERFCFRMSELSEDDIRKSDCYCRHDSLPSKLRQMKSGIADFTVIYSLGRYIPQLSRILSREGVNVPNDVSLIVYEDGESAYLGLDSCCYIDSFSPRREAFFKWVDQRLVKKDLSGIFNVEMKTVIRHGKTLKINVKRKAIV